MKNILQLLEHSAATQPNAPAYCDEQNTYSFAQTLAAVCAIGTALAQNGAEKRAVALYLGQGADCVLAMLGTLAAGGFYAVLDTAQPAERVATITGQLDPAVLLTDEAHSQAAKALGLPAQILTLQDCLAVQADTALLGHIRGRAADADLAYILFTSGSTGLPKGVAITHRNVLSYSEWLVDTFHYAPGTVLGNQTPLYFSMSVSDVYGALRGGACLQFIPKRLFSFPVQLLDYMTARGINTIYWVPSAMGIVANWKALDYTAPPPLQTILFAGEVMPTAKLNYWRGHYPCATFANLYGPTETTDICAYYLVNRDFADDEPLPIGIPCDNCGLLVLDENGGPVPAGQEGELCARGSFLAAGYYNMPDKTAERFCQNPTQPHLPDIIYRTGDLVRHNERGELLYCGRIDHQIKHMGYRIELGEVETAAYGQDRLEACACLFDAEKDRLVLFFTAKKDVTEPLRLRLAARLPAYMRPAVYHRVRQMPQNANGKIDRGALKKLLTEI